jgi:DNA-binding transcriptional regulator YiaG
VSEIDHDRHDPMALLDQLANEPAERSTAGPHSIASEIGQGLTAAEIQMRREALGVSVPWLATRLRVARRTLERWEVGTSRPPRTRRLDGELRALEEEADALVDVLIAWARSHPGQPLVTYRWDDEMPPGMRWPASAHRRACAAAAAEVEGLRVIFADAEG